MVASFVLSFVHPRNFSSHKAIQLMYAVCFYQTNPFSLLWLAIAFIEGNQQAPASFVYKPRGAMR